MKDLLVDHWMALKMVQNRMELVEHLWEGDLMMTDLMNLGKEDLEMRDLMNLGKED